MVRELVGPIAAFRLAAAVRGLPRTRSGKVCRKSIADLARDKQIKVIEKTKTNHRKPIIIFIDFWNCGRSNGIQRHKKYSEKTRICAFCSRSRINKNS